MTHYLGTDGCTYIVGRPFTDEDGEHQPGEEFSAEQAERLHYLEAFVSSGLLYPVFDHGYDRLPPHVWTAVQTRAEAQAKLDGDQSEVSNGWQKPEQLKQAEKEAEVQEKIHQMVLDHAKEAKAQKGLTDGEKVLQAEREQSSEVETENTDGTTDGRIRKATKKAAAKKA